MLRQETKKLCREIYGKRGFWKQVPWLKSEFYEMLDALQKFKICSRKIQLNQVIEEIADFEIMKEQFRECAGEEKECFLRKIQLYDLLMKEDELKELYKNILAVHTSKIQKEAHKKAERALVRVESGYYQ